MSVVESYYFANRKSVYAQASSLIQTGDIIFRLSKTRGPFGIPFSALVAKLTGSRYSHASVLYWKGSEVYALEINDRGVVEYRLIDWFDFCVGGDFAIYRYSEMTPQLRSRMQAEIDRFLSEDFDYDFTYRDPDKYYCTESVAQIFLNLGLGIFQGDTLPNILTGWRYWAFKGGNLAVQTMTGKGFDMNEVMYYPGNQKRGMLASPHIKPVMPPDIYLR